MRIAWKFLYLFAILNSVAVRAGDIAGSATYTGPIRGVGIGFFSNVGIGLPSGQTCHGQSVVLLMTSNSRYNEILSAMISAEVTRGNVKLPNLGTQSATISGYSFCMITEGGLGDFPLWQ